jgi:leukotriene-A4 hydrolase
MSSSLRRRCLSRLPVLCLTLAACRTPGAPAPGTPAGAAPFSLPAGHQDLHSRAQPDRVRVRHVALAMDLDFAAHTVRGTATLSLERNDPAAPLVLDTLALEVVGVFGADGQPRAFQLGKADKVLGAPLTITLASGDDAVKVAYRTTAGSEALQWLAPAQTRDRKQPFVFTQGQSILTRSWIPLQDSPGVRVTYEATVRAPEGITVVMSAEQLGKGPGGVWRFKMAEPIPPYLIALAAGDLAFAPISARAGVWAEPSLVKAARDELVDTEAMIQAAEALFGPYRWGRYDIIVLPPSFPFGGMENPRLTFATPTILAGDKSLVGLVAHELAHSWSGNLVTNATWRDFWLNEGFTSYCEQRIMERVFGAERSRLEKQLAYDELVKELGDLDDWQEVLHVELGTRHPDSAFSGVPYEKGSLFLQRLEQLYGRERFDPFLRDYFDKHAFRSVTTGDFVAHLQRTLLASDPQRAAQLDLARWLTQPGLPPDAPVTRSQALALVDAQRARFLGGTTAAALDTRGWVTQQWQHFIDGMPPDLQPARMEELDRAFRLTASGNSEVLADWLVLSIRRGYRGADARLTEFLMNVGRRKFLKPIYSELVKTEPGRQRARAIYAQARPRYHAVATGTLDGIVGWTVNAAR